MMTGYSKYHLKKFTFPLKAVMLSEVRAKNLPFVAPDKGILRFAQDDMSFLTRILVVICFLLATSCDTPHAVDPVFENYFIKYYGSDGDQYGVDIVANDDGSMILLGNSDSPARGKTTFMVKVNAKGDIIWQRQVGGEDEAAVDMELIRKGPHQGKLAVVTNVGPEASSRIRLLRIDQNGVSVDSLLLPLHTDGVKQIAKSITSLETDQGYVITGYADGSLIFDSHPIVASEADQADLFAIKIDETLQHTESILQQGGERTGAAIKAYEGLVSNQLTYHVFGHSDRYAANNFELSFEIILTRSGIQVGGLYALENDHQELATVLRTPSWLGEGYLLAGTSRNASATASDLYLHKLDKDLNTTALKGKIPLQGGVTRVECVSATIAGPEGYYVLVNEIREASKRDIILVKVTYEGLVAWQKSFGTVDADDTAGAIVTLPDGRIALVGTMELKTRKKMTLIVVNENGDLSN